MFAGKYLPGWFGAWKWDDEAKELVSHDLKELHRSEAGSDSGELRMERLVTELNFTKRLLQAKSIECARLQKRVEELEGRG